jgi:hypothetical protein
MHDGSAAKIIRNPGTKAAELRYQRRAMDQNPRCGMWTTLFAFAIAAFICLNVSALLIEKQPEQKL